MTAFPSLAGTNCLVIGAGGFIGTNLCAMLVAQGCRVTGFGRPRHYAASGPAHCWVDASIADAEALRAAVTDADHVFHLLGSADPGASNADPGADARSTVPASLAVLEACRDTRVRRVVFLSSGGTVYRPGLPMPVAETAPTDPISAYGIGKLTVEKYCALFRHLYGLDTMVLRVANPFGPFQNPDRGQGFVAKLMKQALSGKPIRIWGDGSVVRDFVYVADVVEAIAAAADRSAPAKLFNIGSGVGRSLRSVIDDVRRAVGRDVRVEYAPGRAADIPVNVLDVTLARDQLGWTPRTPWSEGLALTRDWIAAL